MLPPVYLEYEFNRWPIVTHLHIAPLITNDAGLKQYFSIFCIVYKCSDWFENTGLSLDFMCGELLFQRNQNCEWLFWKGLLRKCLARGVAHVAVFILSILNIVVMSALNTDESLSDTWSWWFREKNRRHVHHLRFSYVKRAAAQLLAVHHRRGLGLLMPHSLGGSREAF